ncbi:hypothetical protein [Streptomyces sp. NBC_00623]|uniref:hypothetical protein n=1 Tax=Streptomyces sp. NBC_00623 TaxID=2975790 RepID=UPI0030DF1FFF
MSIWTDFGFVGSPYDTEPIPATTQGSDLLVGRDAEIGQIITRLQSSTRHPTVEGTFGVGKTSLISVACYRLEEEFKKGKASTNSLIPLRESIELSPETTLETFQRKLFYRVAEAFTSHRARLEATGRRVPKQKDVDRWLLDPISQTHTLGLNTPLGGLTGGRGRASSASTAYSEFGFPRAMKNSLEACFPSRAHGGFIAVIDNLELMRTSQKVRVLLDLMRDNVLSQAGIRWILCGAQGVIRSAAATPRLGDCLAHPIDVNPIPDDLMSEVISRRIDAYKIPRRNPVIPVGPGGFWYLYDIFNRNLRTALRFAEEYSIYLHGQFGSSLSKSEDLGLLEAWLADNADLYRRAADGWLGEKEWKVFDILALHAGTCRPCDDYQDFEYTSAEPMRSPIKALKEANLVTYEPDELNKRRKIASMTATGWLVAYARADYSPPFT